MALVGYTISDDPKGYDIFRFSLGGGKAQKIGTIKPSKVGGQDLEGLGTDKSGNITAVSESDFKSKGFIVSGIEKGKPDIKISAVNGSRFGTEAGADFDGNTLYNLQANDDPADGKVGSTLYRINGNKAVKIGKGNPVNKEYADGLAIEKGFAVASDFRTNDKDGAELYLKTGKLGSPIKVDFSGGGNPNSINNDSGLAFSPDGKTLYALVEDGRLFKTTKTDINNGGKVTFKFVKDLGLRGGVDYEGLAITNEGSGKRVGSNSFTGFTGSVNADAANFDAGATAKTSSVEDVSVTYGSGSSELPTDEVSIDPIAGGDSSWLDTVNDIV
jgi:hypothetical protein